MTLAAYAPAGDIHRFQAALENMARQPDVEGIMVIMADANHFSHEALAPLLKASPKKIFGAIFPEIVFNSERKSEGAILMPISWPFQLLRVDMSAPVADMEVALVQALSQLPQPPETTVVFCDAFSDGKNDFTDLLFNQLGAISSYVGAGAGSLSFDPIPCVIDNEGLHANSAVLAFAGQRFALGVGHGWDPVSAPMKVTEAEANKVNSINWQPAFDVYRQVVEGHSGRWLSEENFFDISQSYPLGIAKIDAERIIRDPFMTKYGSIHNLDVIHEGEFVCIMHGNMESLLAGARKARALASEKALPDQATLFCIDCISRVMYMKEEFQREINIIGEGKPVIGALTLGEIANEGAGYLEIYNKTVVVAQW